MLAYRRPEVVVLRAPPSPQDVCVVTVTYASRWHLLQPVLARCVEEGVGRIVVVDNGAAPEALAELEAFADVHTPLVAIVHAGSNRGSAAGFRLGLERAVQDVPHGLVWLLDDDNQPRPGSLQELLRWHQRLSAQSSPDQLAVACLRPEFPAHRAVARGARPERVFPRRNACLSYHVLDLPRALVRLARPPSDPGPVEFQSAPVAPMDVPYGPYGGLLLPASLVPTIGYPDERYYLYGDDTDYTNRIPRHGAHLVLVPTAVVDDLERSWHAKPKARTWAARLLISESDFRAYYSIRNRIQFEHRHWTRSRVVFQINRVFLLSVLGVFAARHGRWGRYRLIRRAVSDGLHGRLGRVPEMDPSPPVPSGLK